MEQPFGRRLKSVRGGVFLCMITSVALVCGLLTARIFLLNTFNLSLGVDTGSFWLHRQFDEAILITRAAYSNYPFPVLKAWMAGLGVVILSILSGIAILWATLRTVHRRDGHGTARWATRSDIVETGLLDTAISPTSLIVGGWKNRVNTFKSEVEYLVHSGPESVLLYAPSGSAKTVSLVIPNLLCYAGSAFVLDIKGELWRDTAGYRQQKLANKVLYHDPSSLEEGNARFNPIEEVRIGTPLAVKDAQLVAQYLIPSSEKEDEGSNSKHFVRSARSLLVGIILYECYKAVEENDSYSDITISRIITEITNPDLPFKGYLKHMRAFEQSDCPCAQAVRGFATEQLDRDDKEFGSVKSSLTSPLNVFRDPILAKATSRSDFKIMDLVNSDDPVSLYLIIRPGDRDIHGPYHTLIVNLLLRRLMEQKPGAETKRRELLFMLDEFSSFPALPIVQQSMDVMRGYSLKAFIVLQDVETLRKLFGDSETITSNCKVTIAYTPGKPKTAELLSKMVGVSTVLEKTSNKQSNLIELIPKSTSENEGLHSRPLLTPDEITRLAIPVLDENERIIKAGESLVFSRGCYPIKAVQTPWFFDSEMTYRKSFRAPACSDRLHG